MQLALHGAVKEPAMTYSRAGRTTIGPGCLSAVFGMGTGVSTRVRPPASSVPLAGVYQDNVVGGLKSRVFATSLWAPRAAGVGVVWPSGRLLVPVG